MRSQAAGDGAATLKRLVEEVDAEIAACQATIERDQRWEKRVATRYDVVDAKDNFSSGAVHEGVEDYTAGVMAVHLSADALDKGGLNRFSLAELRAALEKLGRPADGDKPTLFRRLREALAASAQAQPRQQTVVHEVASWALVGAEAAEAELEALLARRRELLGEA